MRNTYINITLNLEKFAYGNYDLRIPGGIGRKELLNIVKDAYQLAFEVNTPSVRIHEKGIVLTALQRIEDVNYLHDGIQLMVETL